MLDQPDLIARETWRVVLLSPVRHHALLPDRVKPSMCRLSDVGASMLACISGGMPTAPTLRIGPGCAVRLRGEASCGGGPLT